MNPIYCNRGLFVFVFLVTATVGGDCCADLRWFAREDEMWWPHAWSFQSSRSAPGVPTIEPLRRPCFRTGIVSNTVVHFGLHDDTQERKHVEHGICYVDVVETEISDREATRAFTKLALHFVSCRIRCDRCRLALLRSEIIVELQRLRLLSSFIWCRLLISRRHHSSTATNDQDAKAWHSRARLLVCAQHPQALPWKSNLGL